MDNRERLFNLTCYKGFHTVGKIFGKSGIWFPIYPDMTGFGSDPKRLMTVARALAHVVKRFKPDVIAGPAMRGIVYGLPVALLLKKPFLFIRPEQKRVQLKKTVEGIYKKGQRVVIIDDAIALSDTKQYATQALAALGLHVVGAAVFLDAWQGVRSPAIVRKRAWLWRQRFPVRALVGWNEVIAHWAKKKFLGEEFAAFMLEYLRDPYAWLRTKKNWERLKTLAPKEKNLVLHKTFFGI